MSQKNENTRVSDILYVATKSIPGQLTSHPIRKYAVYRVALILLEVAP